MNAQQNFVPQPPIRSRVWFFIVGVILVTVVVVKTGKKVEAKAAPTQTSEVAQAAPKVEAPVAKSPADGMKVLSFTLSTNAVLGKPPVADANGRMQIQK